MLHSYLADAKFWDVLLQFDEDLCAGARARGCPHCAAALHSARYRRKPRGVARAVLGEGYGQRLSLCCAREGCRRRTTPPSVRFFSRRVYLGALVVLVTALSQGVRGEQRAALAERFGIGAHTLGRWRRWWREVFPATPWWRGARGGFVPRVEAGRLPGSLLDRFAGDDAGDEAGALLAVLRFIVPLSSGSVLAR